MRVALRCARLCVAQRFADDVEAGTTGGGEAGEGVAEVVEADFRDVEALADFIP
jgi:hypothetical protein